MGVAVASFLIFAANQMGIPGRANTTLVARDDAHGLRRALPFVAGAGLSVPATLAGTRCARALMVPVALLIVASVARVLVPR